MTISIQQSWHTPAFSQVLGDRAQCALLFGMAGGHLALGMAGLPAWTCPFLSATGIPCPGCGLTRATTHLLKGEFELSFQTHAFAPVFLLVGLLILAALILPESPRKSLTSWMASIESKSGITAWILLAMFLYWGFRLIRFV